VQYPNESMTSSPPSPDRKQQHKRFFLCLLCVIPITVAYGFVSKSLGFNRVEFYGGAIVILAIFEIIALPWTMGAPPIWKVNRWKPPK
jgi:predicted branched-subunit amino acid permease